MVREMTDKNNVGEINVISIVDMNLSSEKTQIDYSPVRLVNFAESMGMTHLEAEEIKCDSELGDVYIIAVGCRFKDPKFQAFKEEVLSNRIEFHKALVKKLNKSGFLVSWDHVLYNNGQPISEASVHEKMIYKRLVENGYASSVGVVERAVEKAPELNVKRILPEPTEVIELIHELGGISVLAGPQEIELKGFDLNQYLLTLKHVGLDAIEVGNDKQEVNKLAEYLSLKERIVYYIRGEKDENSYRL